MTFSAVIRDLDFEDEDCRNHCLPGVDITPHILRAFATTEQAVAAMSGEFGHGFEALRDAFEADPTLLDHDGEHRGWEVYDDLADMLAESLGENPPEDDDGKASLWTRWREAALASDCMEQDLRTRREAVSDLVNDAARLYADSFPDGSDVELALALLRRPGGPDAFRAALARYDGDEAVAAMNAILAARAKPRTHADALRDGIVDVVRSHVAHDVAHGDPATHAAFPDDRDHDARIAALGRVVSSYVSAHPTAEISLADAFGIGLSWGRSLQGQNVEDSRAVGRTLLSDEFAPIRDEIRREIDLRGFDSFRDADHGICEARSIVETALRTHSHARHGATVETLAGIRSWGEATFGPASPERIVERGAEEWREMEGEAPGSEAQALEGADVVIVLLRMPGILQAIDDKMARNRRRTWNLRGDGTGYHVKDRNP